VKKLCWYHPEQGFYYARDADRKYYLLLDNQVQSNIPGRIYLIKPDGSMDLFFTQLVSTNSIGPQHGSPGNAKTYLSRNTTLSRKWIG
jgi:hypothetical protein